MKRIYLYVILGILGFFGIVILVFSVNAGPVSTEKILPDQPDSITTPEATVTLANPAAVYCIDHGGENRIVTAPDGSQSGLCVFSDGRSCDDWGFFRTGKCD